MCLNDLDASSALVRTSKDKSGSIQVFMYFDAVFILDPGSSVKCYIGAVWGQSSVCSSARPPCGRQLARSGSTRGGPKKRGSAAPHLRPTEAVSGAQCGVGGAWLEESMARVVDDEEFRLWESLMKIPSRLDRTDHVVAALDNEGRDMSDLVDIVEDPTLSREPTSMQEEMVLNPRKSQCEMIIFAFRSCHRIWEQGRGPTVKVRIRVRIREFGSDGCKGGLCSQVDHRLAACSRTASK